MKKSCIISYAILMGSLITNPAAEYLHAEPEEKQPVILTDFWSMPYACHDHTHQEYGIFHFNESNRAVVSSSASLSMSWMK
jgi:hypothetical protein